MYRYVLRVKFNSTAYESNLYNKYYDYYSEHPAKEGDHVVVRSDMKSWPSIASVVKCICISDLISEPHKATKPVVGVIDYTQFEGFINREQEQKKRKAEFELLRQRLLKEAAKRNEDKIIASMLNQSDLSEKVARFFELKEEFRNE
jgi:hypothetical protein